jgi:hypothetical protein
MLTESKRVQQVAATRTLWRKLATLLDMPYEQLEKALFDLSAAADNLLDSGDIDKKPNYPLREFLNKLGILYSDKDLFTKQKKE